MESTRVASLALVIALACTPLPAQAQGGPPAGGGPANNVSSRVADLEAAVAALQQADTTLQNDIDNEAAARQAADATLQTQIDKLKGNNITASDLEGNYNLYFIATGMEPQVDGTNVVTSYVITGSLVLGPNGTGHGSAAFASGRQLTERTPGLNWLGAGFKDVQIASDGALSWVYSNGTVTVTFASTPNDPTVVTPAGNGQVMVGIQGGPPGDNQAIMLLTRQP